MTQEQFEDKVQSLPEALRKTFRESLEINVSKRIVNRFMSVIHQAYAEGMRTALASKQNVAVSCYDNGYRDGKDDLLKAMRTFRSWMSADFLEYLGVHAKCNQDGIILALNKEADELIKAVEKQQEKKTDEKHQMEEVAVKAMADTIGIDRLEQIVRSMKAESEEPEELPF